MTTSKWNGFWRGTLYGLRGISAFYSHPGYWPYALLPMGILLLVYVGAGWWFYSGVLPGMTAWIAPATGEWEWLTWILAPVRWLLQLSIGLLFLFFLAMAVNTLYELFGGWFFARLVTRFELRAYQRRAQPLSWWMEMGYNVQCAVFAVATLLIWLVFWLISWVVPVVGPILLVAVVGYRYALSYCFSSGFNRRLSVRGLQRTVRPIRPALYGFGVVLYLIMLVPLLPVLVIPGLVIGGAMLLNEELDS